MISDKKVVDLNIHDVLPNRFQPRIKFDDNSIQELAESIRKYGVIQPIVVRSIGDKFEIIAGERRYKASVIAGKATIPAIINEMSDDESVEVALIENVQREDLTPIEKAISYRKILDLGKMNQETLAKKIGKSQSAVANTLRLLALSEETQEALLENKISERHARSLLKLKDDPREIEILNRIINERLTVRKTDDVINTLLGTPIVTEGIPEATSNQIQEPRIIKIYDEEAFIMPDKIEEVKVDPGFMDLDRIQREAQDIQNPVKPVADMNSLLKPDNQLVNPINQGPNINKEGDVNSMNNNDNNKFFNFFEPETSQNPVNQQPASNPFSLDNFFGPHNNNSEAVPSTPAVEEVSQPMNSIPEITPTDILGELNSFASNSVNPSPIAQEIPVAPIIGQQPIPEVNSTPIVNPTAVNNIDPVLEAFNFTVPEPQTNMPMGNITPTEDASGGDQNVLNNTGYMATNEFNPFGNSSIMEPQMTPQYTNPVPTMVPEPIIPEIPIIGDQSVAEIQPVMESNFSIPTPSISEPTPMEAFNFTVPEPQMNMPMGNITPTEDASGGDQNVLNNTGYMATNEFNPFGNSPVMEPQMTPQYTNPVPTMVPEPIIPEIPIIGDQPVAEIQPVLEPMFNVPTEPAMTVEPITEAFNFNVPDQPIDIPQMPTPQVVGNINTAVDTVRTCSNTIKGMGFDISIEEIDFEDSYQIILKIKK